MKKGMMAAVVLAGMLLAGAPRMVAQSTQAPPPQGGAGASQTGTVASQQDVELLRQDIRSKKKQLIAENLRLTESEAAKFWPVYDQYTQDLSRINDTKYDLIKQYSAQWGSMTDDEALIYIRQWLETDIAVSQLRDKYVPLVRAVLPGKKVATFFQLDRRISMMIDLQISSQIPLVQDQH